MIDRPDVNTLLAGELGQWLTLQTGVRDDAREKSNSRIVKCSFILLPVIGVLLVIPALPVMPKMIIAILLLGFAGSWCWAPRREAVKQTKTGINDALAKSLDLNYQHDLEGSQGFQWAKSFSMLPHFDREAHEDLWSGEVAGRSFSLHESHLQEWRGSGKSRRLETVFRGPIMTIACPGLAHAITLIERAQKHRKFLGFGRSKDHVTFDGIRLDVVDMVHPDFEDAFSVWSNDQVEARVLANPVYVERLTQIELAFAGENVRALFHQGELLIVLEAKNMFESGNMDASRDRQLIEETVAQFMALVELAEYLSPEKQR